MKRLNKRPLYARDILRWADRHREATGRWPTKTSGVIPEARLETWAKVDGALRTGTRGLDGGSSLAQFLAQHRGVRNVHDLPDLSETVILAWADEHRARTGNWPTSKSGKVAGTGEVWGNVDNALRLGLRGLSRGSSLARLLAMYRGVRNRKGLPKLTEEGILSWADAHHTRTGAWPSSDSGPVLDAPGETWTAVEMALHHGRRGMPGGSSLAWLLAEHRGVGDYYRRLPLTGAGILDWCDNHFLRTGGWPKAVVEPIPESPGDTWAGVDSALKKGLRTLPKGGSLARLLAAERGVRNPASVPDLNRKQILRWADAHFKRNGAWPTEASGPIPAAPGETWAAVNGALYSGGRGLRGSITLARLLEKYRGKRVIHGQPDLTKRQILEWADAHFTLHGRWPRCKDGEIPGAGGQTWQGVDQALRDGLRGQPGGSSLTKLLSMKRGVRNPARPPDLTIDHVLAWADAHQRRTGRWPTAETGPVADAEGETWAAIDLALRKARRGFTEPSSLAKLLEARRGVPNKKNLPRLTAEQVLAWAEAHHARTGRWPTQHSGPIVEAPGETWLRVDAALRAGGRGFSGRSSLARLQDTVRSQVHRPTETSLTDLAMNSTLALSPLAPACG